MEYQVFSKMRFYVMRTICPHLRNFVIFSWIVARKRNVGPSNYDMANFVTERIQWGLVGEVGTVAETLNKVEIDGLIQRPLSSCLQDLDTLLMQRDAVVVPSKEVAQKWESQPSENIVKEGK